MTEPRTTLTRRGLLAASAALAAPAILRPAAVRAADETIRIGWIRPTTGRLASSFAPLYAGGNIAIEEINGAGGILGRKIELAEEDDEASPAKEPSVVKKLAESNIRLLVGPTGSAQVLSSLAFTTPAKMIQCGVANGAELGNGEKYPYHYMPVFTTDQEGQVAARYMVEQLKAKKIGILHESTAFGEDAAASTVRTLQKLTGGAPAATQAYQMTANDMRPFVKNLHAAGCEGVIMWMASNVHIGMALGAMAELKWAPMIVGHVNLLNDNLYDLVPPEALKNVYGLYYRNWTYTDKDQPNERAMALTKKLIAHPGAKGIEAYVAGTPQYDFLHLMKMVVEAEKSFEPDVLKRALDNLKGYKAILGTVNFTQTSHAGIGLEDITLASVASSREQASFGSFRRRAPGA